ncbi:MAG TPA: hypothetical protein VFZ11_02295 [Gemmatimonadaceae bacterium]
MPNDDTRELPDERKQPRSGAGTRAMRAERLRAEEEARAAEETSADEASAAEARAKERSVIPGPRSFAGENIAATADEQTRDRTTRRGPGPQDDVQASDRIPPALSDDVERKD